MAPSGGASAALAPPAAGGPSAAGGPPPPDWRVIVPVLDEAAALPRLLNEMGAVSGLLERAVFVDNGSSDGSTDLICAAGGRLVREPHRGYGFACRAGVAAAKTDLASSDATSVVAFMEGDGSDDPTELPRLLGPVLSGDVDLMIGSRRRAVARGAPMAAHQRWGNLAAAVGMHLLFGVRIPDNGPFRAVRLDLLDSLDMEPRGYAWTTEMVAKAHLSGARIAWVETSFRPRAGRSKISGTVRGTVGAFRGIFGTLVRLRLATVRRLSRGRL